MNQTGQAEIRVLLIEDDKALWTEKLNPIYKEFAQTVGPDLMEEVRRP